jgi:hypothetical protein
LPPSVPAPHQRDPREDYTRHLESRRASLAGAIRQHMLFGYVRVAALAVVLAIAYAAFARGLLSGWWVLAPTMAFFWAGARLDRAIKARARFDRAVAFYQRALARLDGRWAGTGGETGERFLDDGHLYARDLDVFGPASLFELLSCARTAVGEDTLAAWLKAPAEPAVARARQEAVAELAPRTDLREDLAVLGEEAGTRVHVKALAMWGEQPARLESSRVPFWAWPLSVAGALAALSLLVWLLARAGETPFSAATLAALRAYGLTTVAVCGAAVWQYHARTAAIFGDVDEAAHELGLLVDVLGRLEKERFTSTRLTGLRAELDVEGHPPSHRIARLRALVDLVDSRDHFMVRLLGPMLLWDLHLAYAIERWRRTSGSAVRRWVTAVGEMEALSSVAGYHYEHPDDVFPDLDSGPACFDGDELGHPLLPDAAFVRNDVRLIGAVRMLVVSGSNMSGKSTLLRTVGVNAVLAQAGAPVRARRLRLSPLQVGASIRIQDSLQAGVSRFYAEITQIGQIMRRAEEEPPVLFLIDELLHGTNSHDRRIGAEAIVRGLVDRGAIGLVTTHDLALAHVAEALGARGANVHFEDSLENGRMYFDYRMRPGVVQKSNAIELMRSVGLDV